MTMKIALIGYSGSGKSTLAQKLGKQYGAEVLHIDTVHWLPGWQERPREEKERIMEDFLNAHDAWVIDGNYKKLSFDRRMEEADRIIFMAFNRFSCLWRVYKRYRTYKGKTRASMTEGCDEKLDREFLTWILRDGRSQKHRMAYRKVLEQYPEKVEVIRNQRQLNAFEKRMTEDLTDGR